MAGGLTWSQAWSYFILTVFIVFFIEQIVPSFRKNIKKTVWNLIPLFLTLQNYKGLSKSDVFDDYKALFVIIVNLNVAHVALNVMLEVMARRQV